MVPIALNMDILLAILSLSPPKTATSIMATCRFLYHEGAKVILQQPVCLYGSEQEVLARLRFIQAEDLSRCSYVRNLSIFTYPISEAVAKVLVDIVPRMSNLVGLGVRGDHLFEAYPYLVPAFASLRAVKTLSVNEAGAKSCELVRTLQSELVDANILFASTSEFSTHPFAAFSHLLHLLRRSASTLQKLSCKSGYDTHADIETTMSHPQIVYPNVRDLILDGKGVVPCLPPYIQAFPNLVHLQVEANCSVLEEFPSLRLSQNQALASHDSQMNTMRQGLTKDPLVWKHIQTYTGTLSDLQALGVTFPIPRLYLTTVRGMSSSLALTEVLAYTQPIHLTITYEDQPFSHTLGPDFLTALRSDGASRLRSLALTIDLMAADVDSDFDVGQFWTSVETALARLPLRDLYIVMGDISLPETASTAPPSSDAYGGEQSASAHTHELELADETAYDPVDPANPARVSPDCSQCSEAEHRTSLTLAERTLEDFDVGAFVGRLSTSIPTLRNALVSIARPTRSRWGGGMRTRHLGKHDGLKSEMHVNTEDSELYEIFKESLLRMGLAHEKRWFSSMARAWYRVERG